MSRNSKTPFIVVALIVLYLVVVMLTTNQQSKNKPYTIFDTQEDGACLIYDTLKIMDYNVSASYTPIDYNQNINDVQIIVQPYLFLFSETNVKDISQWANGGGRVILFCDAKSLHFNIKEYINYTNVTKGEDFTFYECGPGSIVVSDPKFITNEYLMDNTHMGHTIIEFLDYWEATNILFNEYYHGYQNKPGFWNTLPLGFKIIVCQLVLIIIGIIMYKGKRFGRPIPYFEEIEREENEYTKTLATIFRNAGLGEVIVEYYFNNFIYKCSRFFSINERDIKENIVNIWKENDLQYINILEQVMASVKLNKKYNIKKSAGRKDFFRTIDNLNKLTKQINRRYL